jgi:hypothetical protein
MNDYLSLIMVFAFATVLYLGTILWTEVLFPDKEPSLEEQEALKRVQVERLLAVLQPGLFDKVEEEEKRKVTLTPAYRR